MILRKDEPKDISVIIVNYKSQRYLERCLGSLYLLAGKEVSLEVIIVNNDSRENLEKVKNLFPDVKVVVNAKNVGFGRGNNIGAREASGKFLLFLNPDTEILTKNIGAVLDEFSGNDDIGVIGGGVIDEKNKKQDWSAGREFSLYNLVRNNLGTSKSRLVWSSSQKTECDWVAGTSLFIRKNLFDHLGGFDERFFMYFEDVDICRRTRVLGKKVIYFPEFKVFHGGGGSYLDKSLQKKHYYDSMEKYFKKHSSVSSVFLIKLARRLLLKK